MTILDANILLYAYNADAPQQEQASRWLTELLESGETIGLPWVSIWAFIRVRTNARLTMPPRSAEETFGIVGEWLALPGVIALNPGPPHREILERLAKEHGATGPLLTDAVLAALALEHGAALASTDQNFRRFPAVRWVNPLERSKSRQVVTPEAGG